MYKIVEKKKLNSSVTKMVIEAPFVAKKAEPGQFVILRVDEKGERVPFTIADFDRDAETVTIIFQIVGAETALLNEKNILKILSVRSVMQQKQRAIKKLP